MCDVIEAPMDFCHMFESKKSRIILTQVLTKAPFWN